MSKTRVSGHKVDGVDVMVDDERLNIDPRKRKIGSQPSDERVRVIIDDWKRGKLVLQPDFQREYVWDKQKATRLIESALMGIPLPVVYFAEEEDGSKSVIDGQQRLRSFISFVDGKFPDGKIFKLGNMQVFPELANKSFKELPESHQDRILDCVIRSITFSKDADPDLKFNVFERLNTGSVQLNAQELRNCIYRGPFNNLIRELASNTDFKKIVGPSGKSYRMWYEELVLRYIAFYDKGYLRYKAPANRFLNEEARDRQYLTTEKEKEFRRCFKNSVALVLSMLGEKAFRRFVRGNEDDHNGEWEPQKFNLALYDILMTEFADREKSLVMKNLDAIYESYLDMQTSDTQFVEWIYHATSSNQAVRYRFDCWRKRLDDILRGEKKQRRCFSREIKERLFKKNPICAICGQKISAVDDAAVDHIVQYWVGGETTLNNARLTHRFCNWARPKDDVI